ncbi:hypothetical protein C5167_015345 [Papaver somniferum]|uniref:Uncharacterized protein n=1 Tax=Papaver somniferum TaxID=3469 RepID=A0A4Y7J9T5_PAPSO|nr:hypothetical protein C5167_015345 [Papaver somniferum]
MISQQKDLVRKINYILDITVSASWIVYMQDHHFEFIGRLARFVRKISESNNIDIKVLVNWIVPAGPPFLPSKGLSIFLDRKVDELDKAIAVESRDLPGMASMKWRLRNVGVMKKAVEAGKSRSANVMRHELMRVPNDTRQAKPSSMQH